MEKLIIQHLTQAKISEIVPLDTLENLWATKLSDPPELKLVEDNPDLSAKSALDVEDLSGGDSQKANSQPSASSKKKENKTSSENNQKGKKTLIFSEVLLPNSPLQTIIQYNRFGGLETTPIKIVAAHSSLMQKASIYGSESRRHRLEEQEPQEPLIIAPQERSKRPLAPRYYEAKLVSSSSKKSKPLEEEVIHVEDEPIEIFEDSPDTADSLTFCFNCLGTDHMAVMCKPPSLAMASSNAATQLVSWSAPVPLAQTRCLVCGRHGHNYCQLTPVASQDDGLYRFIPIRPKPRNAQTSSSRAIDELGRPVGCF